MSKKIDLTGKRFGKLTVLEYVGETPKTKSGFTTSLWKCKCDCGKEKTISLNSINGKNGTKSCGCLRHAKKKHGMSHTRLHDIWTSMKKRCCNPNEAEYASYGGRGIRVCDEWTGEDGASNFIRWALSHGYTDDLTIERIDVNGNYEPSNCCWIPRFEQAFNKQDTIRVTYNGKTKTLKEWAKETGINYYTLYNRQEKYPDRPDLILSKSDIRGDLYGYKVKEKLNGHHSMKARKDPNGE